MICGLLRQYAKAWRTRASVNGALSTRMATSRNCVDRAEKIWTLGALKSACEPWNGVESIMSTLPPWRARTWLCTSET